jgi:hypothetical protein
MHPRLGFDSYSRSQQPQFSGLGALCALAALGLIYAASTASTSTRPLAFVGGLLVAAITAFCNVAACYFTSAAMGRVMRQPMRYNRAWLVLMLLGDMGLFWGFHRLAPSNSVGWLWIAVGAVALLLGLFLIVITSTVNAESRRSIDALY